jgi:putative transcriptional regulator
MPSEELEIKNHIRRLRFEHGEMTQDDLAKRSGVTRHTIMALEAGKYFPSLLLAFRIARVFRENVEQVFEFHD